LAGLGKVEPAPLSPAPLTPRQMARQELQSTQIRFLNRHEPAISFAFTVVTVFRLIFLRNAVSSRGFD
jgi:hypothetical protein